MKIDLIELLNEKTVCHPSTVTLVELRDGNLRILLSGYPWWLSAPRGGEFAYEFRFTGVTGNLDTTIVEPGPDRRPWDEALEDLSILPVADLDWSKPRENEIYCSEPLKNARALYVLLERHLSDVDSYFPPHHFLNTPNSKTPLASFIDIASSNSFLLARAPQGMTELLGAELGRQGVKHTILHEKRDYSCPGLRVRLADCDFLCHAAQAILPD